MISRSPLDRITAFAASGAVAAPAAVTAAAVFTIPAGEGDEAFDGVFLGGAFAVTPSPPTLLSAGVSGVVGVSEDLCRRGWRTRRSGARILGLIGRGRVANADAWAPSPLWKRLISGYSDTRHV